jgi:outer membrane receptor for ferrienterochelin and colicins
MSRGIRVPLGVMCVVLWMSASGPAASAQQPTAVIQIVVRSDAGPVHKAQVIIGGKTTETDASGQLTLEVPPGPVEVTVVKEGYNPVTVSATATLGPPQEIPIVLERQTAIEEHVTVSATRTDKRFEDQPMRVELLDAEEIVEKQLMTPGDIVMMLNEMGGLRVQATSPSLGAASVRVQGMRGRYTRFLSDGLPLFGTDVGGLGLLQIPPTDLGQVEVIKGVASALYGAGALGGVVDLISRRPTKEPIREAVVNRTSRGGTDATLFAAQPFSARWSGTMLVGGHWQERAAVVGALAQRARRCA